MQNHVIQRHNILMSTRFAKTLRLPIQKFVDKGKSMRAGINSTQIVTATHYILELTIDFGTYTETLHFIPLLDDLSADYDVLLTRLPSSFSP